MGGDGVKGEKMQAVEQLRPVRQASEELENLFRSHHDRVFRIAYRITGNLGDAEDVLQTVFLRLIKRKQSIDLSPNPESYLHRAAVNASIDLLRGRQRVTSIPFEEAATRTIESSGPSPETEHTNRELQTVIRQSVARLSEKTAEIVALKYFEGYSNREIAGLIGISQIAVAVMLHRARTRLRKEIRSFMEGSDETE